MKEDSKKELKQVLQNMIEREKKNNNIVSLTAIYKFIDLLPMRTFMGKGFTIAEATTLQDIITNYIMYNED